MNKILKNVLENDAMMSRREDESLLRAAKQTTGQKRY
jgi:hypothetical protein